MLSIVSLLIGIVRPDSPKPNHLIGDSLDIEYEITDMPPRMHVNSHFGDLTPRTRSGSYASVNLC